MDASSPAEDRNRAIDDDDDDDDDDSSPASDGSRNLFGREEVIKFPTQCSNCRKAAELSIHTKIIPHFKEIIIMSMVCGHCGFKTNEIKGGGGIPEYGSRITLKVQGPEDLNREVVKSNSAGISVPELELELAEGGLEGVYTTVEGLVMKLVESLESGNPFGSDIRNDELSSVTNSMNERFHAFLRQLKSYAEGKRFPFTIVISDPLGNSFVSPRPEDMATLRIQPQKEAAQSCYDSSLDPGIKVEHFQRSHEQNEALGITDMKSRDR